MTGLALALALIASLGVLTGDDQAPDAETRGPDITLSYFDGTSASLGDLVGQPVVLNFWASWCPACIGEMPAFGNVHREFDGEVAFVGINTQEVDLEAAMDLVEVTDVDYRLAHDPDGELFREFGGLAMPTTVFIAADGSVARVHSGVMFEEELRTSIEDLSG